MDTTATTTRQHKRARTGDARNWMTLRTALIEARDAKDGEAALKTFEDAKQTVSGGGIIPTDVSALLLSIIMELPNCSEFADRARQVYEYATDPSHKPNEAVFTNSLRVFAQLNDLTSAQAVLGRMIELGHTPKHRSFAPLLKCALDVNELAKAHEIYDAMHKRLPPAIEGLDETDVCAVLNACANAATPEQTSVANQLAEHVLSDVTKYVHQVPTPAMVAAAERYFTSPAGMSRQVTYHCTVPLDTSCQCSHCGEKLQSIEVDKDDLNVLLQQTELLAPTQFQEKKRKQWDDFKAWITRQESGKYDTVVDGANIAYYRMAQTSAATSSGGGARGEVRPCYEQIDSVVNLLESQGKKPIIFLHSRHFQSRNGKFGLDPALLQVWQARKILYIVPGGHNDDVFWLFYAMSLPGRALLVTNDQMRDHRFEMLQSTMAFSRWKERHQTNFDVFWDVATKKFDVLLFPPKDVSLRVQVSPSTGRWHLPVRIPLTQQETEVHEMEQRLSAMGSTEIKQEFTAARITAEQYRKSRLAVLGCDVPESYTRKFEWMCVGGSVDAGSSSSSSSSSSAQQ